MTHVTAQFQTFTVYSSSSVLIGHCQVPEGIPQGFARKIEPVVIPELQDAGIIRVACGDYHNVALNSSGEVFTWGGSSQGALGLDSGDSAVSQPRKVTFGKGDEGPASKEPFVFAIAAGGWHSGALVLDGPRQPSQNDVTQETDEDTSHEEAPRPIPGAFPSHPLQVPGSAGGGLGAPYFRVGFAGRGRHPPSPS